MSGGEEVGQRRFRPPADAVEILVVRHGASAPVAPGQLHALTPDGWGDPELAPEGVEQAELVARRLEAERIDAVFVTPLRRTRETAAPTVQRTGLEPTVIKDLAEVHLGDWEGGEYRLRFRQGDPIVMRALQEERWDVIPGAESHEGFEARVRSGIEAIVEQTGPGRTAAAFVHGGVIGEICRQATASRRFAFVHADNCSLTKLVVFADGRWLLRSFNETTHLDETII